MPKSTAITRARLLGLGLSLFAVVPCWASLDPHRPLASFLRESWQSQQGLPQNSVLSLAQTKDGYLWIGTEEGLARFDGTRFAIIPTGLHNKTVTALLADTTGSLWVGTNGGGLARLTAGVATVFTTRNGLPSNSILCLHQDERGTVWAGTDGGGLAVFDRSGVRVFTKGDGLPDNVVFSVASSRDGSLWVGTRSGLVRYANGGFSDPVPELVNKHVRALITDQAGTVWVGTTSDGLFHIVQNQATHVPKTSGLISDQIQSLFEDLSGTLYVGTLDAGISRFDGTVFSGLSDKEGLLGSEIHAILEDREGDLWIGTAGGGLNCLKEGVFSMLTSKDGLPSDTVLPILQARDGAIWIGSDRGLTVRRGDHITTYSSKDGLPDDLVLSLTEDAIGEIWAGTRRGLARYAGGRWSIYTTQDGLGSDFIAALFVDRQGRLWAGTRGGLTRYDGKFLNFTTKEGLSNNYVLAIAQDDSGAIWAGTEGGATRLQNDHFTSYTTRNGLSNDVVRAIYPAPDGGIWFATNGGGLNRLKKGHFGAITADRGLFDDSLHSILPDGNGRLWLTCNHGVFSTGLKQLNDFADGKQSSITQRVYGIADGLRTSEFNGGFQPASCRLKDGRLMFPSTGGIAVIDPASLTKVLSSPTPVIERVLVDQRSFPPNTPVVVPPGKGQIEVQFSAPEFRSPNSVQFSYMLEGFDKEWFSAGSRRTAYYTNIPPGQYRFKVRVNTGGTAVSESALPLALTPHFYQTLAFYTLTSVLILTVCLTIYSWRVDELRDRERKLLALISEKTAALRESEKMLRRSRDELEIRIQERTLEMVRTNQALQTEIFVRRQAENQLRAAKEEAEASTQALRIILTNVGRELLHPLQEIHEQTQARLDQPDSQGEQQYLQAVARSTSSLSYFITGLADAAAETDHLPAA